MSAIPFRCQHPDALRMLVGVMSGKRGVETMLGSCKPGLCDRCPSVRLGAT